MISYFMTVKLCLKFCFMIYVIYNLFLINIYYGLNHIILRRMHMSSNSKMIFLNLKPNYPYLCAHI